LRKFGSTFLFEDLNFGIGEVTIPEEEGQLVEEKKTPWLWVGLLGGRTSLPRTIDQKGGRGTRKREGVVEKPKAR